MLYLKQSTASQSVLIGPFVDDTDGATAETGLTIANTDVRLSKNGGNLAAKNSGGGTHDEAGWYQITLDATDTDTVGTLQLHVKVSGALMVHHEYQVLEESIYDALIGASAAGFDASGRVDVGEWLGNAVTASSGNPDVNIESIDANAITATSIATDAITNAKIAANAIGSSEIATGAIDADAIAANAITDAKIASNAFTAAKFASGAFDAVWTVTTRVLTAGTNIALAKGTGVTGFNDLSAAQVNAEVVDVMNVDTFAEPTGVPAATNTITGKLGTLYLMARNEVTVTATKKTYKGDDGAAEFEKDLSDDGTTYTETEVNAP